MIGSVKLTKNVDPDKYIYCDYSIRFDSRSFSSLPYGSMGRNVTIFGADMSLSVHIDNKVKYILILGDGPTQELDDITFTVEAKYSINFTQSNRKFCLSLHYNGSNSFLFFNAKKIHQLKAKVSAIKKKITCV